MGKTIAFNPLDIPLYILAKPAGAACNLRCKYCYYLEKKEYYTEQRFEMSDELLEKFISEYIAAQPTPDVLFTWHGGEPMLRGLKFYERALRLEEKYGRGRHISNVLQTNGILLDDEWCQFLRRNNWLVGISIDGPEHLHDQYRYNAAGTGSFKRVMRGIELMKKHGVEFNTMSVINHDNAPYATETYQFLKEIGSGYMQFSPIVERLADNRLQTPDKQGAQLAPWSVTPEQFGQFYIDIFDQWVKHDVGEVFVQLFDATLACWVGVTPGVCLFTRTCGHAAAMEWNGDIYACDHFVFPEYRLGNIRTTPLLTMMLSQRQLQFGNDKHAQLPQQCLQCKWLKLCHGECPKNRFATTADGEPGLNYLCKGYDAYFTHVAPYMAYMANELSNQRPPANVMNYHPEK